MAHIITRFHTGQHVDEKVDGLYSIWEVVQDWDTQMIPKYVKRTRVFRGLDREYANVLCNALMKESRDDGNVKSVTFAVEFLLDCDFNRAQAESVGGGWHPVY